MRAVAVVRSVVAWVVLCTVVAGLGGSAVQPARAADIITFTGAGATFPYPLYSRWFADYNRAHPDSVSTIRPSAAAAASNR